jgi:hypothetical protein
MIVLLLAFSLRLSPKSGSQHHTQRDFDSTTESGAFRNNMTPPVAFSPQRHDLSDHWKARWFHGRISLSRAGN